MVGQLVCTYICAQTLRTVVAIVVYLYESAVRTCIQQCRLALDMEVSGLQLSKEHCLVLLCHVSRNSTNERGHFHKVRTY